MKEVFIVIFSNFASILCAGIAGFLAFNKIYGWGWFLFVSIVLSTTYSFSNSKCKDDE